MGHESSCDPLSEASDQHSVGRTGSTRDGDLLSVARKGEKKDVFGGEMSELHRRSTGDRLCPEIADAVAIVHESHRVAIGRPREWSKEPLVRAII